MLKTIIDNFHIDKIIWIIISKLKFMILIGLIAGVITGALTYYMRTDTYMAQISLYVYSNPDYITDSGINISTSDISSANSLLNSYMQILKSDSFLRSVIEEAELADYGYTIGYLRKNISSQAVSGT
ncbi:MAG: hypothetical protein IKO76_01460, partial [Butyrivibrio sp.]|nr:hypothetical protein [Butyrivibrio sp.]